MPIKRKDGSIYRLRGPNKLLIEQNFWNNDEHVILHNFDYANKHVVEDEAKYIPEPVLPKTFVKKDEVFDASQLEQLVQDISEEVNEPQVAVVAPPEPPPKIQENIPEIQSIHRDRPRDMMYCLPAEVSQSNDGLYDETVVRINYKPPFRCQVAKIQESDVKVTCWTTVQQVTNRSILFDRQRRRWWKVVALQPCSSGDGCILECTPSDIRPSFDEA